MEEIWKSVVGYEGYYEVSNYGNVRSIGRVVPHKRFGTAFKKGINLIPGKSGYVGGQYYSVNLHRNYTAKTSKVHRLVAIAFIPNPDNKREVNHKDANKFNNKLENLEWVTPSENVQHSYDIGVKKKQIGCDNNLAKLVLNIQTGIYYESLNEASRTVHFKYNTLKSYLNGQKKNRSYLIYA